MHVKVDVVRSVASSSGGRALPPSSAVNVATPRPLHGRVHVTRKHVASCAAECCAERLLHPTPAHSMQPPVRTISHATFP